MIQNTYLKKNLASRWFSLLQQTICYEFEKIETEYGKRTNQKPKFFKKKNGKNLKKRTKEVDHFQ